MVRVSAFWGSLAGVGLVFVAASAAAQAPAAQPEAREPALEGLIAAQLSVYDSLETDDSALFGGTALLRHWILAGGAGLSFGGALPDQSVVNASLLGGLVWQTDLGLRLDLLGSFGVDAYHAEDAGLFSEDPGTGAALACAGVRAGVGYRFASRHSARFIAGVFASYEADLARVTRRYQYLEDSWFSSEPSVREQSYRFGDRRLALGASIGVAADLLPH